MEAESWIPFRGEAPTTVWWDVDNCALQKSQDAQFVAHNIWSALAKIGYSGPISKIHAYGSSKNISSDDLEVLKSSGVDFTDVPTGVPDACDKRILIDMLSWAGSNKPPANILLISGDQDFSYDCYKLSLKNYCVLLAYGSDVNEIFPYSSEISWSWKKLIAGSSPTRKFKAKSQWIQSGDRKSTVPNVESSSNVQQTQIIKSCQPSIKPSCSTLPARPSVRNTSSQWVVTKPNLSDEQLFSMGKLCCVLKTLEKEMVLPTYENIDGCIRYNELSHQQSGLKVDVKGGLDLLLKFQLLEKRELGNGTSYYTGKGKDLWRCVQVYNDMKYSKEMWDTLQTYVFSSDGRSTLQSTECRYEAATVLKKVCLKDTCYCLGDALQIFQELTEVKKWLHPNSEACSR